ncbi:MAG: ATPase, T2SS/T4P/T4SS family [Pseudomonadota bacterium]
MDVLVVRNELTGDIARHTLTGSEFIVGAARKDGQSRAQIQVESLTFSSEQFRLERDAVGWSVIHCGGSTVTRLGGVPLAKGERNRFSEGAVIEVSSFRFGLEREDEARTERQNVKERAGYIERLEMLADEVHRQLLAEVVKLGRDERGDQVSSSGFSASEQEFLNNALNDIVRAETARLRKSDLEVLLKGALHRRSAELLVERQKSGGWAGKSKDSADILTSRVGSEILANMSLRANDAKLDASLRRFKENFDTAIRTQVGRLAEGDQRQIVKHSLTRMVQQIVFGLGPIQSLVEMDEVSEIMVVSRKEIYIEKAGKLSELPYGYPSEKSLEFTIQKIVNGAGRRIDQQTPLVDARLEDGSRVNAVIPPLALKGPNITIRKFRKDPLTLETIKNAGSMTHSMMKFLEACVKSRMNIVISGGTGSGKTAMLNALSQFIDDSERVVTIEDTAELRLTSRHVVTLQARPAGTESSADISIQRLVANALRMRPDRIIVGECRGAEAFDMLQAMNTGHAGSMTTAHANTPQEMLLRLESLVQMGFPEMPGASIKRHIASAVDFIVQVQRNEVGRRTTQISELIGIDEHSNELIVEDVFSYRYGKYDNLEERPNQKYWEAHHFTGFLPKRIQDLMRNGYAWQQLRES